MCHIHRVLQNICDKKPKVRYLLAVDDSKVTLKQITKAVSKAIGTNKVKNVSKEDALLNSEISQSDFDMLLLDLRMDAAYVKENMQLKWQSETGLVENITKMVKEYKAARNLVVYFIVKNKGKVKFDIKYQNIIISKSSNFDI